jgi:hypothetical protein
MPGYTYKGTKKNPPTIITPNDTRRGKRGRPIARCGTYGGYRRHYRDGEYPCTDCREAAKEYMRTRRGSSRRYHSTAPCGTEAGYQRHRRLHETPCLACCDAVNQAVKERRNARKAA